MARHPLGVLHLSYLPAFTLPLPFLPARMLVQLQPQPRGPTTQTSALPTVQARVMFSHSKAHYSGSSSAYLLEHLS